MSDILCIEAVVVFRNLPDPADGKWYMAPLKDGFKHVEVWLNDRDVWLRIDPCYELAVIQAHLDGPREMTDPALKPTFVTVQRELVLGALPLFWCFGPLTCVDIVKATLGLRASRVFTPYQLYRYLTRGP